MRVCEGPAACFEDHSKQGSTSGTTTAALADIDASLLEDNTVEADSQPATTAAPAKPAKDNKKNKRSKVIRIGKPPRINMSRSSLLIGDTCYLGCSWFYLESTMQSLCKNCNAMIAYKPITSTITVKKSGNNNDEIEHVCFDLPSDIQNGRIPANFTNYAKQQCAKASTCVCSNTTLHDNNVNEVQVHRVKAFAILNTMMDWIGSAVENYYNGVNTKLNVLSTVKSKRCQDRRAKVRESQAHVVKSLRDTAEETRKVMSYCVENIKGKEAQQLLNEFVNTFNQRIATLHNLMKSQVDVFAKSLNGLCVKDQIQFRMAAKAEKRALKKK